MLKFIDILEAYNVKAIKDTKILNDRFKDVHVYKMCEMFDVLI